MRRRLRDGGAGAPNIKKKQPSSYHRTNKKDGRRGPPHMNPAVVFLWLGYEYSSTPLRVSAPGACATTTFHEIIAAFCKSGWLSNPLIRRPPADDAALLHGSLLSESSACRRCLLYAAAADSAQKNPLLAAGAAQDHRHGCDRPLERALKADLADWNAERVRGCGGGTAGDVRIGSTEGNRRINAEDHVRYWAGVQ